MRISGKSDFSQRVPVEFLASDGTRVEVVCQTLPWGFEREVEERLPEPPPEIVWTKDPTTGKKERRFERDGPAWARKALEVHFLRVVALVVEGLRDDRNVEFDARRESFESWFDYYRAVAAEMDAAGISGRAVKAIANAIGQAGAIDDVEELAEIAEGFSSPAATTAGQTKTTSCSLSASDSVSRLSHSEITPSATSDNSRDGRSFAGVSLSGPPRRPDRERRAALIWPEEG